MFPLLHYLSSRAIFLFPSFSNLKKGVELVPEVVVLNPFLRSFYRWC